MQTMFTGFSENGEILNESQNIRLLFQKVQNPIMTQIKASFQVSYDLDQYNTFIYYFIFNFLTAEDASIGDPPPEELQISTRVARKHQRLAPRDQVAQYSQGFTPIGPNYQK